MPQQIKLNMISQTPHSYENKVFLGEIMLDFLNVLQRAMHSSLVSYFLLSFCCFHFTVFFGRDHFLQLKKKEKWPSHVAWMV